MFFLFLSCYGRESNTQCYNYAQVKCQSSHMVKFHSILQGWAGSNLEFAAMDDEVIARKVRICIHTLWVCKTCGPVQRLRCPGKPLSNSHIPTKIPTLGIEQDTYRSMVGVI